MQDGKTGIQGATGPSVYFGYWSNTVQYSDGSIVKYGLSNNLQMYQLHCPLVGACNPGVPSEDPLWVNLRGEGATGAQGQKGDTGEQGITGAKGEKGDTGEQGVTGATGTARAVYRNVWQETQVGLYEESDIVKWTNELGFLP